MKYMGKVLEGVPSRPLKMPDGIVRVAIDPGTGRPNAEASSPAMEYFYAESIVSAEPSAPPAGAAVPYLP